MSPPPGLATPRRQFVRFVAVGVVSNGALFVLYLVLTSTGLSPALSMSLAYAAGVVQTYAFNRSWTFSHSGDCAASLARYATAYGIGYVVNLCLLRLFVDGLKLPHQWVQGAAILFVAVLVFVLQKHWVFRNALQPSR
jgi:putative flippase GtrA